MDSKERAFIKAIRVGTGNNNFVESNERRNEEEGQEDSHSPTAPQPRTVMKLL